MSDAKPTTKPVKTAKSGTRTYQLFANGELWTAGESAYLCGHVMDPENIEEAIDAHEEEMHFICQSALAEFGF